jgi:hypothetical protein
MHEYCFCGTSVNVKMYFLLQKNVFWGRRDFSKTY